MSPRRWRDWPWALKLSTLFVAMAIVPLSILTVFNEATTRRQVLEDAGARDLQRARNTAALLDKYLEALVGHVQLLALAPATVSVLADPGDGSRATELSALLANVRATQRLEVLTVIDNTGTIVSATSSALIGRSRISAPFFLTAIAGQSRAHDPRYRPEDGLIAIHASVPVRDARERIVGVVAARVPLDEIDRLVAADTDFGGFGEYGLLWDERGIVISSPAFPERRFRPLGQLLDFARDRMIAEQRFGPATAQLLSEGGPGEGLVQRSRWRMYEDRSDPPMQVDLGAGVLQVTPVPMTDRRWTYGVVVPEARVLAAVREQSRRNLAVALATALLALGLAIASARRLSWPLKQIGDAARSLAAGDLTRRVQLERRDEIGRMADAFDSMAEAIARKDEELRRHAESLERRVAERTAELRGLLGAIPDLIFKVARDGRLLDHVVAKGEALALAPERFLGRKLAEVMPEEVAAPAAAAIECVLAGGAAQPFEYRLEMGREIRYYEARASASGSETVVFVVRDITDRRRHEERTRFLARAGAVLTSSLDYGNIVDTLVRLPVPFAADLCVVDLLEHGRLRVGAVAASTPELEALAHSLRLEYPVETSSDHPVAASLRTGSALVSDMPPSLLERIARSPDHLTLMRAIGPRSMIVLPLVARGQTLGVMSFVSTNEARQYTSADLSLAQEFVHRAGIALDNARLYRDVQESSHLKDEFLGIVSHELRTPLNAVLGWVQVLRRTSSDPEQLARALAAIERNARAQAQLVEDLLDTSRVVSGKLRIELASVGVRGVVEQAIESFRPVARARGIELTASVAEDVGHTYADADRLQQVIGNLLSNAVKFTPAGGRVEVTAERTVEEVVIRVTDTGAGITPDFLPYVFDRFRQADSTTTRAHGGLGIGLAIARHLVELHGGTIRAESPGENRGSTFTVVLPAFAATQVSGSGISETRSQRTESTDSATEVENRPGPHVYREMGQGEDALN